MRADTQRLDGFVRSLAVVHDEQLRGARLREAMEELATEIIRHDRSQSPDARPTARTPVRSRRAAIAVVAVLLSAGAMTIISPMGGHHRPAIAGWQASTEEVPAELPRQAWEECRPSSDADPSDDVVAFFEERVEPARIDARGNAATAAFVEEERYVICSLLEEDDGWRFSALSFGDFSEDPEGAQLAGRVLAFHSQHRLEYGSVSLTAVIGRVSGGVATVLIERVDGMEIEALVEDGVFTAWWPSLHDVSTVRAYDADGALLGSDDSLAVRGIEMVSFE